MCTLCLHLPVIFTTSVSLLATKGYVINFATKKLHDSTLCSVMLFHCHSDHRSFSESCDFFGREMLELTQCINFMLNTHQLEITLI